MHVNLDRQLHALARTYGVHPEDVVDEFNHRAAILEYDAGMSRADAEAAALVEVQAWLMRLADVGPTK